MYQLMYQIDVIRENTDWIRQLPYFINLYAKYILVNDLVIMFFRYPEYHQWISPNKYSKLPLIYVGANHFVHCSNTVKIRPDTRCTCLILSRVWSKFLKQNITQLVFSFKGNEISFNINNYKVFMKSAISYPQKYSLN